MTDAMSKKERLARGSAVIKVMKVIPRPGNFLKSFIDPRKLPKAPQSSAPKGLLAEMPWLDVKNADFTFNPKSAKPPGKSPFPSSDSDVCNPSDDRDLKDVGLPEGDKVLRWFDYRTWMHHVVPSKDGNIPEHFNIVLGLIISMAKDSENENFADAEAYPCVQFLRTIKTPDGVVPYNVAQFIEYIQFVCQKMVDEG